MALPTINDVMAVVLVSHDQAVAQGDHPLRLLGDLRIMG
jgi:hypothetical protein